MSNYNLINAEGRTPEQSKTDCAIAYAHGISVIAHRNGESHLGSISSVENRFPQHLSGFAPNEPGEFGSVFEMVNCIELFPLCKPLNEAHKDEALIEAMKSTEMTIMHPYGDGIMVKFADEEHLIRSQAIETVVARDPSFDTKVIMLNSIGRFFAKHGYCLGQFTAYAMKKVEEEPNA